MDATVGVIGWLVALFMTASAVFSLLAYHGARAAARNAAIRIRSLEGRVAQTDALLGEADAMIRQWRESDPMRSDEAMRYVQEHPDEKCLVLVRVPKQLQAEEAKDGAEQAVAGLGDGEMVERDAGQEWPDVIGEGSRET